MKKLFIISIIYFLNFGAFSQGQQSQVYATSSGAIDGYDLVAYFKVKMPVKGKESYSFNWKGATWYFSSEENRSLFMNNPEKYAPEYGGYCAYAVSQGQKAKIDPEAWHIEDDKLYLNYNKNVQNKWMKNMKELIEKADKNWGEMNMN